MSEIIQDKVNQINCLNEEIDSLYHQAALKLGVSDCVLFVLYMLHTNDGKCLLYDIYKLSGISKQTVNSAIRKLENEETVYLEKCNGKSKMVESSLIDSYDISLITLVITREDEDAQKPSFSKVSSRG